jgi:hypothetical protein
MPPNHTRADASGPPANGSGFCCGRALPDKRAAPSASANLSRRRKGSQPPAPASSKPALDRFLASARGQSAIKRRLEGLEERRHRGELCEPRRPLSSTGVELNSRVVDTYLASRCGDTPRGVS